MANQNHRGMNWLTSVGFVALGAGYLWEFARGSKTGNPVGPAGDLDGLKRRRRMLGAAPEGAPLVVQDGIRSIKFYPAGNIDNRLKFIIDQIRKDSMDKKTVTEARAIVSGKCRIEKGGVNWCLPAGTLIVRKPYDLVPIEKIQVGDVILGDGGWTEVLNTFDRGMQPIIAFRLNNGSTLRCSPEHKLFVVPRRGSNGKPIPRGKKLKQTFVGRREDAIEVLAKDIVEGDELLQPESIPFGSESINSDRALIMGAYIAEGWLEPSRASIAGIPDSKGVREKVIAAADRLGITHSEDEFKVRLRGRHVSEWLSSCGELSQNKRLTTIDLDRSTVEAVLEGINADASFVDARKQPMPRFCTTSSRLAQQYRLLYRMLGHSASVDTSVRDGAKLLHKVSVRTQGFARGGKAWAKVQRIESQPSEHTFDLETESNRIYLPECDVVVHNCVTPKDWEGELRMLFWAVTNPNSPYAMRYTRDHATIDMFGSSDSHRRLPSGDCFVHGTLVLREDGSVAAVETLKVGDRIWGYDKWTTVIQTWDKGILPTWKITLSNGRTMRLTPDHKVWVRRPDGELDVIRVAELTTDIELIQPERVASKVERAMAPNGDLFVKDIETDYLALPCFDFATEDKFIWLPEADWTVHNCDDFSIRLGALARAIGYSVKCRIVAPAGQPNQWAHIYLMVGDEAGNPNPRRWLPMDPTEPQHGPFWEVSKRMISTVKDYDV